MKSLGEIDFQRERERVSKKIDKFSNRPLTTYFDSIVTTYSVLLRKRERDRNVKNARIDERDFQKRERS